MELLPWLARHHVAHLATRGAGGAHGCAVFYALMDGGPSLVWTSAQHVLHSQHLLADGTAALSIAPSDCPVDRIEGCQLRGTVDQRSQAWLRGAWGSRFPEALHSVAAEHRFWRFTPTWARLVVWRDGERQRREWDLG